MIVRVRQTDTNPEIIAKVCGHDMLVFVDSSSGYYCHEHDGSACDKWRDLWEAVFTFDHLLEDEL